VNLATVHGTGPAGRVEVSDLSAPTPVVATPRARRAARERGIDWTCLSGSGAGGRIREQDVLQAAHAASKPVVANGSDLPEQGAEIVRLTPLRRTIAHRMQTSHQTTAPVTLTTRLDATNLVNLRQQFKSSRSTADLIPGYTEFVIKLTSLVLADHPLLRAQWTSRELIVPDGIHIGVAVETDVGLVVPVVRDVPAKSLTELTAAIRDLIDRARQGQLKAAEMQGGVFTITNLGAYGIDAFTPMINLPEAAILGLGRIRREAVVVDQQIVARDQLTLSLTFDHRIVDGAPAARFLQQLSQALESPSAWLLR